MGEAIAFWALAALTVVAALNVIFLRNLFRAALSLILSLLAVAGLYITLSADFLAAVQVLIYIGGISVLIILAIMLTRDAVQNNPWNQLRAPAFFVAAVFLAITTFTILNTQFPVSSAVPVAPTTASLADKLLGKDGFVLPVEIGAALLLTAILGAIISAREK